MAKEYQKINPEQNVIIYSVAAILNFKMAAKVLGYFVKSCVSFANRVSSVYNNDKCLLLNEPAAQYLPFGIRIINISWLLVKL